MKTAGLGKDFSLGFGGVGGVQGPSEVAPDPGIACLQQFLNLLAGAPVCPPTGTLDPETLGAIRDLQASLGIDPSAAGGSPLGRLRAALGGGRGPTGGRAPTPRASSPRDPASSRAGTPRASSPRDPASSPRDPASARASTPRASSPRDPASSPRDPASSPRDPASAPRDPASAPRDPASSPRDPASSPRDPASAPRDPASAPRAGSTRADGASDPAVRDLVEDITRARVPARDRAAFDVVDEANQRTESGGRPVYSTLRTTADFPASYGRGQLVIREHLSELSRLSDDQLGTLGTSREEIRGMQERGRAAESWSRALTGDGRCDLGAAGLSAADRSDMRSLVRDRNFDEVERRYGARFAESTGLPASEIRSMAEGSMLSDPSLRREFRDTYRSTYGEDFDPRHRDGARMAAVADRMVERHPELGGLSERLGSRSLGHYLGAGDTAENPNGWYARAAAGVVGRERFDAMMERADPVTTRMRHLTNFERATAAVEECGLTGEERTRAIARLSRQFHGAPGTMMGRLFEGGDLDRPRCHSRDDLMAVLGDIESSERRGRSDANFRRELDRAMA